MKLMHTLIVGIVLNGVTLLAADPPPLNPIAETAIKQLFERADSNNDALLSKSEITTAQAGLDRLLDARVKKLLSKDATLLKLLPKDRRAALKAVDSKGLAFAELEKQITNATSQVDAAVKAEQKRLREVQKKAEEARKLAEQRRQEIQRQLEEKKRRREEERQRERERDRRR